MPILCYHDVDPRWEAPMAVTPEAFAQHLGWLARNRTTVDLRTAVGHLDTRGRLPAGMAAITFDDGFAGVLEHAVPLMETWGISATVFVVADTLLDQDHVVDWVDQPPSWPLRTLGIDDLRDLRARGFRIGSHSSAHRVLTDLDDADLAGDLTRSREILEDVLHEPVDLLAYPRGVHDGRVRWAARRAGYAAAFSLPERREPATPYSIPRVGIYRRDTARTLRLKANRHFLPVRTTAAYPLARAVVSRRASERDRVARRAS